MLSQLPILPVLLPLLGAPLCALLSRPVVAWAFACAVAVLTFAASTFLLAAVWQQGAMSLRARWLGCSLGYRVPH